MIEPKRLSDTTESDVERALLRAGRARAPKGAKARALLVASGAITASSLASTGAAAEGAAFTAKMAGAIALKWIGLLGVAGVVAVTSAVALRSPAGSRETNAVVVPRTLAPAAGGTLKTRDPQPPQALPTAGASAVPPPESPLTDAPVVRPRESAPMDDPAAHWTASPSPHPPTTPFAEPPAPPAEVPAENNPTQSDFVAHVMTAPRTATAPPATLAGDAPPAPNPISSPARVAVPVGPSASTLHAEIDLLNSARAALSAGDRPRALELLGSYETQFFPGGAMRPEEAVLRVEALVASGDRPAADRVARTFLASNPSSPYAPRIEQLLSQPNH